MAFMIARYRQSADGQSESRGHACARRESPALPWRASRRLAGHELPQEGEERGEAFSRDVQALPELAIGRRTLARPPQLRLVSSGLVSPLFSVLPPQVLPERPELGPGPGIRLHTVDGGRDAARQMLEALPGVVGAFGQHRRRGLEGV